MKKQYKIVGKTDAPMPDLIIDVDGVEIRIDPFVGCVVGLSKYNNSLERINKYIDTMIGKHAIIDLDLCGFVCGAYIPYKRKDFKIINS